MKEALRRALRTFAQSFTGVFLAGIVGLGPVPNLAALRAAAVAAAFAGAVAVVSFAHNLLEDQAPALDTRG